MTTHGRKVPARADHSRLGGLRPARCRARARPSGARSCRARSRPLARRLRLVTARHLLPSLLLLAAPRPAEANQVEGRDGRRGAVAADSTEVLEDARDAQARFERRRTRFLPITLDGHSGPCDERVGRFCTWYDEGEWVPEEERPEVVELRRALLGVLDRASTRIPGDGWILGQRVWYRAEAGAWADALEVARRCGDAERWWCAALEGFALHGLGRHGPSLEAFERALALMPPEWAREWRVPRRALDREGRDLLEDLGPEALEPALERMWMLADPLWLVPGNDRRTAHYARWTVAVVKSDARNPFGIRWGDDLEELTVRNGWELGWERAARRDLSDSDVVIGHKHPQGRDYLPDGGALADPAAAGPEDLVADRGRPRSFFAPDYAPVLLPMEADLAVFPRGDRAVVVARPRLPEDTTYHADHAHRRPWMEPGEQASLPARAGLFLASEDGSRILADTVTGPADRALGVEVPAGGWVASVEAWSPPDRRAGRHRQGLEIEAVPPDLPTLSDLLLLEAEPEEPATLEEALDDVLPGAVLQPGDTLAVGWELYGLGGAALPLGFSLSVERVDRGLFRRAGELLGVLGREPAVSLEWEEPGPRRTGPHFRSVRLGLPDLDPGRFRVRLELQLPGRTVLVSEQEFRVSTR